MEDRDGKKPFIIPKTNISNKDVFVSEKTDSRNVIELFNDIKSCAFEAHFDFRQNELKSCDTIRNLKLQKLYNEKRIQMKKNQDPTERFAFHLITSRDIALNIASDGLCSEHVSFSIDKYLGNPKDGIHLSRRPDVVLASSGARGLTKFGLLVCKVLLGKGYATIPSKNNEKLSAQLHYDYHFCKIQPFNKEQRHIDNLLANSLVFCYEHEDFETLSRPSQILPIAILWYDLKEKFSSELTPTPQESQQRNGKNIKLINSYQKQPLTKPISKSIPSLNTGTWNDLPQDTTVVSTTHTTPTKYPSQLMLPYSSLYTSFSDTHRHPRLLRTAISSAETIPLPSPQHPPLERSQSDISSSLKQIITEKKFCLIDIPLNSTVQLIDPRLKTLKQSQNIYYLESKALKNAIQQQKRLNHYYDPKNGSTPKTHYALIPFHIQSTSSKSSFNMNHSSLYISVIDCFHFGLKKSPNQLYIDLEEDENKLAHEQMKISDQLIHHERKLNSQEIRLHLREKRERKLEEQRKNDLLNSKIYINNGRKLLKEHQEITPSTNNQISLELLDFFSYEYRNENRPHVKRILAELIGVFVEKYGLEQKDIISNHIHNRINQAPFMDNLTINSVIDMDLESPSSQGLCDHDERFPVQTQPSISIPLIQTLSNNTQLIQPTQIESALSDSNLLADKVNVESNENNNTDGNHSSENDSNRSRDEFVKLLTKEAYTSKSPSPSQILNHRRRSHDSNESNSNKSISSTRTVTLISNNHEDKLMIETTNTEQQQKELEEPTVKRIKVDLISPTNDDINSNINAHDYHQDFDGRRQQEELNNKSTNSPSSFNNRYPRERRNDYKYERNRSLDRSYNYHQRNINNSTSPHSPSTRHQRFNYNHQSVAEHPRFANINTIPSPVKNFNYNSFSSSNYSQSITDSIPNVNQNLNSAYYNDSCSNYQFYQDNYGNNFPQPPPLMSTTPGINFSNSHDSKASNTFERLQMLLQNGTNTSYDYSSSSYTMNQLQNNNNNSQWSSTRYSSGTDTNMQNNRTFTYNDAEQLLTFVQHLRN